MDVKVKREKEEAEVDVRRRPDPARHEKETARRLAAESGFLQARRETRLSIPSAIPVLAHRCVSGDCGECKDAEIQQQNSVGC